MKKEYLAFVDSPKDLPVGKEIELTVRDLTPGVEKYDARYVRAIVADSPDKLPDGDILWLRSVLGLLYPDPWVIKITGDLGEYIPKRPYWEFKYAEDYK